MKGQPMLQSRCGNQDVGNKQTVTEEEGFHELISDLRGGCTNRHDSDSLEELLYLSQFSLVAAASN
jgi:hypothetical protein